jgi:DNA-binding NtrC family response regulator
MDTGPKRTILIVDDEESVRSPLSRLLTGEGHAVLEAADATTALQILQEKQVHLVISDQMMPGMSGVDLLKLVRVRHPHVLRIMLTGDPDPEIPVRSINESEVYRFIRKPWNNWELRTILHFAFEVVRLQEENAKLIALGLRQRKVRDKMESADDPVGLEAELQLLAEAEAELLGSGG